MSVGRRGQALVRQRQLAAIDNRDERLKVAESNGYWYGLRGINHCKESYRTGEEWITWFRGWKRGQVEYEVEVAAIELASKTNTFRVWQEQVERSTRKLI